MPKESFDNERVESTVTEKRRVLLEDARLLPENDYVKNVIKNMADEELGELMFFVGITDEDVEFYNRIRDLDMYPIPPYIKPTPDELNRKTSILNMLESNLNHHMDDPYFDEYLRDHFHGQIADGINKLPPEEKEKLLRSLIK